MPPLRCALEKSIPAGIRLGAFMVPGLALWLPSGYSWGAAWLLLLALLTWPQWRHARVAAKIRSPPGTTPMPACSACVSNPPS